MIGRPVVNTFENNCLVLSCLLASSVRRLAALWTVYLHSWNCLFVLVFCCCFLSFLLLPINYQLFTVAMVTRQKAWGFVLQSYAYLYRVYILLFGLRLPIQGAHTVICHLKILLQHGYLLIYFLKGRQVECYSRPNYLRFCPVNYSLLWGENMSF